MTRRCVLAGVLVAVALTGCADRLAPPPATTLPAGATGPPPPVPPTMDGVAACPLGERRCPHPKLTPGTVIPSAAGVCTTSYNPRRSLTERAAARVLAAYGFPPGTKVHEWDHLVARWAGGTSTSSNVWPMISNADQGRKDRLEQALYLRVCRAKTLKLDVARQRMRTFWAWW